MILFCLSFYLLHLSTIISDSCCLTETLEIVSIDFPVSSLYTNKAFTHLRDICKKLNRKHLFQWTGCPRERSSEYFMKPFKSKSKRSQTPSLLLRLDSKLSFFDRDYSFYAYRAIDRNNMNLANGRDFDYSSMATKESSISQLSTVSTFLSCMLSNRG